MITKTILSPRSMMTVVNALRALSVPLALGALSACTADTTDGEGATDVGSAEVAATQSCGAPLAIASIGASTEEAANPAGHAVDGNAATRWSGKGVGAYVTADLGSIKPVCGLDVQWYEGATRANTFAIAVSTDGKNFTTALSGVSALGDGPQSYALTTAASARYVRLTVLGNTKNTWASVNELHVTGPKTPPAIGAPGTYKPSATTTGVPAGTVLTPYNTSGADLVITKDGTVLDSLEIYGDIKVRARNVTIRRSRLHGGKLIPASNSGIVNANHEAVIGLLVEDCTITPDVPSYYRDGIVGHDYTSRRNHIYQTNDGLGIFNRQGGPAAANVVAEANYIHTLTQWSDDPAHADGTHNDCIQVQGGENIHIIGNTIVADSVNGVGSAPDPRGSHAAQGILLQQNVTQLANVVVESNWLDNGSASLYVDHSPSKGYTHVTVTVKNNHFGRNQYDYGNGSKYALRITDKSASTVSGLFTNRWEDTGVALAEGRDLGIRYTTP